MPSLLFLLMLIASCHYAYAQGNEPSSTLPVTAGGQPTANFLLDLRTFLNQEDAVRCDELGMAAGFVAAGGIHGTAGGFTSGAFATTAYTSSCTRVSQASVAINYQTAGAAASDTCWVLASASANATLNNFTRVSGTDYFVDCVSATRPTLPADSVYLMRVTIAGSAITAVTDLRQSGSLTGFYDVSASLFGGVAGDGTDQAQEIQAAINTACGNGGGVVYVGPGTWILNAEVSLDAETTPPCSGLTLRGAGADATTISVPGATRAFRYNPGALSEARVVIENLTIIGTNGSALDLITFTNAANVTLQNLHIRNTSLDCVALDQVHNLSIRDTRIEDCVSDGVSMANNTNVWTLSNIDFNTNGTAGAAHMRIANSGSGSVRDSNFEGGSAMQRGVILSGALDIEFTGNFFEFYTNAAIEGQTTASTNIGFLHNHIHTTNSVTLEFSTSSLVHANIIVVRNRFGANAAGGTILNDGSTASLYYCENSVENAIAAHVQGYSATLNCILFSTETARHVWQSGGIAWDDVAQTYRFNGAVHIGANANTGLSRSSDALTLFSTPGTGTVILNAAGSNRLTAGTGGVQFESRAFAALGAPGNGTVIYCSDCTIANPCAAAGTGALAKRINGGWICN